MSLMHRTHARLARFLLLTTTGVLLGLAVAGFVYLWINEFSPDRIGDDYDFYVGLARRFLETGVLYGDRQLTGEPYHVLVNIDNLYPPPAILLFIPFVFVPAILWWAIPILIVAYVVWRQRPSIWTWPLIAFCLLWPRTLGSLIVGNSDIWSACFVAAGLVWAWPTVLGFFKPAFAPFFIIGIRHRSYWMAVGVSAVVALFFLPYWPQYVTAATHWDLSIDRSLLNVPMLLIPVIAWLGKTDSRAAQSPSPRTEASLDPTLAAPPGSHA